MSEPHERHNKVTTDFILSLGKEGVISDGSSGLMVVLESLMLAIMRINTKAFNIEPNKSATMVEMAYQRALEEFTKDNKYG